jgi:hypothetical protein
MNSFPRLLCLATLATTAAFAQAPASADLVASNVEPKVTANQPDLQVRPSGHVVLPTATVLRLKLDRAISTASAKPGERFTGTLTRPVDVDGTVVAPAGTKVNCEVQRAQGGRRFRGKPVLYLKALSFQLPSGEQLEFTATVVDTANPRKLDVDQEGRIRGSSPNPMDKIEMGALAGSGAIAGAVIAGPEGFLIGTASGAVIAAGHMVVKQRELNLAAGTELIFQLDGPATLGDRPQRGGMQ